jgi:hypothetical protein
MARGWWATRRVPAVLAASLLALLVPARPEPAGQGMGPVRVGMPALSGLPAVLGPVGGTRVADAPRAESPGGGSRGLDPAAPAADRRGQPAAGPRAVAGRDTAPHATRHPGVPRCRAPPHAGVPA